MKRPASFREIHAARQWARDEIGEWLEGRAAAEPGHCGVRYSPMLAIVAGWAGLSGDDLLDIQAQRRFAWAIALELDHVIATASVFQLETLWGGSFVGAFDAEKEAS